MLTGWRRPIPPPDRYVWRHSTANHTTSVVPPENHGDLGYLTAQVNRTGYWDMLLVMVRRR